MLRNSKYPKVAESQYNEILAGRTDHFGHPQLINHPRFTVGLHATFAMACIERWALVAGEPDGEDSAGRAKLRRMTPKELVDHACACSKLALEEFERQGWLPKVPEYQVLVDAIQQAEND